MNVRINEPISEGPDASWACDRVGSWVLEVSEVAAARHLVEIAGLIARNGLLTEHVTSETDVSP